jgi:translation initiation factor IF-2
MEDLEENIVTLSEILDVRAEADGMAEGWVLESSVKQTGKTATVLIKRGTLRLGDVIVAGKSWARVRALRNEAGVEISEAPPGTPVQVLGWRELPDAGVQVLQAPDEGKAKTAVEYREEMAERLESSQQLAEQEQRMREKEAAEEAAAAAEAEGTEAAEPVKAEPGIIFQNFIIKADVAGSVEAVCGTVQELGSNEVQSKILRSGAGGISEYDVDHAAASKSIIVNFNLPILPHIRQRADEAGVRIIDHSVIYHVVDDVKNALSDLLPYNITHKVLGEADVLQVFAINVRKRVQMNIAGCKVRNGTIKRTSRVKVIRRGEVIFDGRSSSYFTFFPLHRAFHFASPFFYTDSLQVKSTRSSMSRRTLWKWARVPSVVLASKTSMICKLTIRFRHMMRSRRSEHCNNGFVEHMYKKQDKRLWPSSV